MRTQENSKGKSALPRAEVLNSVTQVDLTKENAHLFDLNLRF